MKRNPILVLGLGVLLSFGVFGIGCGDDSKPAVKTDAATDAKRDTGSTGGTTSAGGTTGAGGAIGTGGVIGTGGATTGLGGAIGTGGGVGTGGAIGTGGSTGLDAGPKLDAGPDAFVRLDVSPVDQGKFDVNDDVPVKNDTGIDGGAVLLDGAHLDVAIDTAQVSVDAAIDTAAVDTTEVDGGNLDTNLD